jgi:hypothetical protein
VKALKTTNTLGVMELKAMKNDKGREGGHKIGEMGRRRLWKAPYTNNKDFKNENDKYISTFKKKLTLKALS